jgi:hypothetical protein
VEESGFYHEERDGEGLFRWTNGKARLVIPLKKHEVPGSLLVHLSRPQDRSLRITINDVELFNEPAPGARSPRDWELRSPLSGVQLGEKLVLEIASNTTSPKGDDRQLGVQVRAIRLLRGPRGGKQP